MIVWWSVYSPGHCFARPPSLRCAERGGLVFELITKSVVMLRLSKHWRVRAIPHALRGPQCDTPTLALGISMAKSRERVIFFKRTVSLDHSQSQCEQFVSDSIDH